MSRKSSACNSAPFAARLTAGRISEKDAKGHPPAWASSAAISVVSMRAHRASSSVTASSRDRQRSAPGMDTVRPAKASRTAFHSSTRRAFSSREILSGIDDKTTPGVGILANHRVQRSEETAEKSEGLVPAKKLLGRPLPQNQ